MQLDIRTPIALMFSVLGILLTIFGFVKRNDPEVLKPSLGININLWWGLVMIAFALSMWIWSKMDKGEASTEPRDNDRPRGH